MTRQFRGVFPAMITPMDQDYQIDWDGLKNNIDYYLNNGIPGLIPVGSTGEGISLSKEERFRVSEEVVNHVNGRVPVIVGATAESTQDTIMYAEQAKSVGADGVMILNSFYHKPTEEEIFQHFRAVNDAVDIPIMLYNNPSITGVDISEDMLIKIGREIPNLAIIKESSGSIQKLRNVNLGTDDDLQLFCGWDDMVLESFFAGATGWVSVAANIIPKQAQELFILAVEEKNYEDAWKLYKQMIPLLSFLENSGKGIQVAKRGLELAGQAGGTTRAPRAPLTPTEEESLKEILQSLGVLS